MWAALRNATICLMEDDFRLGSEPLIHPRGRSSLGQTCLHSLLQTPSLETSLYQGWPAWF